MRSSGLFLITASASSLLVVITVFVVLDVIQSRKELMLAKRILNEKVRQRAHR